MTECELADEIARRTALPRDQVLRVLASLSAVARERELAGERLDIGGHDAAASGARREPRWFVPSANDVETLIAAARNHPLGLDFLLNGELCAVATMFRAHAFTVDAARERLRRQGPAFAGV